MKPKKGKSQDENSNDIGKDQTLLPSDNHLSEEPQEKENLPPGSYWMEDEEFYKMLLKRRSDSKGRERDVKDIFGE